MLQQMKRFLPLMIAAVPGIVLSQSASHCTRGRLFVSDVDTSKIQVFDLDGEDAPAPQDDLLAMPGLPGQWLQTSATGQTVTSISRGTEALFWQDGGFSFLRSGVLPNAHEVGGFFVTKDKPTVVDGLLITCTRPIHFVAVDNRIALFCDGAFDANVNSTIWVLDENKIRNSAGDGALVFTKTLDGSHHGVCVPVDDGHVLTSLATPERVDRDPEASALPNGFEIVDYEENLIHGLNEVDDPHKSCAGMHGTGATGSSTFTFACDQNHGGILALAYDAGSKYSSRALSYPQPFDTHRTGSLKTHPKSELVVGNFADRASDSHHLVVFNPRTDLSIEAQQLEMIEGGYCAFDFEGSSGELVMVWMPTGNLRVYSIEIGWMLLANVQVFKDMTDCTGTTMAPGHGHAYISRGGQLVDVDLTDLAQIQVVTRDASVSVNSAVVAGVPHDYECTGPAIPYEPARSRSISSGWFALHHEPTDIVTPGSKEQTLVVLRLRRDIANALSIPLNRVYIGEIVFMPDFAYEDSHNHDHVHDEEDSDFYFQVKFSNPVPADVNPESASQLLDEFGKLVIDRDSDLFTVGMESPRIVGGLMLENPLTIGNNVDVDDHDSHTDDGSISSGGVATIVVLSVCVLGLVIVSLLLFQKAKQTQESLKSTQSQRERLETAAGSTSKPILVAEPQTDIIPGVSA